MSSDDYKNLVLKIESDKLYQKQNDRFKRMRYLVKTRHRQLFQYGEKLMKACGDYERKHLKSLSTALSYAERAKSEFKKSNKFSELARLSNLALRYFPQDWNNWKIMSSIVDTYLHRAVHYFNNRSYEEAYFDLKHCSSVLFNFRDKVTMHEHFKREPDLLVTVLVLKIHLFDHVNLDNKIQDMLVVLANSPEGLLQLSRPCIDDMKVILMQVQVETMFRWLEDIDRLFSQYEEEKFQNNNLFKENFQLSPKIRLDHHRNGGRCYRSSAHIHKNETILLERPISFVMFSENLFDYCSYCCRSMSTFWPCGKCIEISFCSYRCSMLASEQFHKYECGIYGMILGKENFYSLAHVFRLYSTFGITMVTKCEDEIIKSASNQPSFNVELSYIQQESIRTKPIYRLNSEEKYQVCRAITSLLHHRGKRDSIRESSHTVLSFSLIYYFIHCGLLKDTILQDFEMLSRLAENLCTAMLRTCTNGFCWAEERDKRDDSGTKEIVKVASCICFVSSFFNHSCEPNVQWAITESGISLQSLRNIEPGELLSICYGPKRWNEFAQRQSRLRDDYCFYCRCMVCLRDSARINTALHCFADPNCPGPVLLNKYEACLTCEYSEVKLNTAWCMVSKLERTSNKFMNTIKTMIEPRITTKDILLSCVGLKRKPRTMNNVHKDSKNLALQYPSLNVKMKKLEKLEKYFKTYVNCVYRSSYHLFDKCALMLYAYNQFGLDERGIRLVDPITHCLDVIFPELTDAELISLIYKLDFICKFFDNLCRFQMSRQKICMNMLDEGETFDETTDSLIPFVKFWSLQQKLNSKLFEILRYDMHTRGTFFPKLHQHLTSNIDNGGIPMLDQMFNEDPLVVVSTTKTINSVTSLKLDADEKYFKKIYEDCQRRMASIDKILN